MFVEERPHLTSLPAERFRCFRQESRTVDDAGRIQVGGSSYAALPAAPHTHVTVRIYEHEIEIVDPRGALLRRYAQAPRKGTFTLASSDRLFNPSRERARLLHKAELIGPHTAAFAQELFARLGRPGQRALYGLTNLARIHRRADIEPVCARLLAHQCLSYGAVKHALDRLTTTPASPPSPDLTQIGPDIRPIAEYQAFWNVHATTPTPTPTQDPVHADVAPRT
jgi:hypothetical protein